MTKPKMINLNSYEPVGTLEELEGLTGCVIIVPQITNGFQPPTTYWKRTNVKNHITVENVDGAIWFKDVRISQTGTDLDYAKRVDWWFENALADDEYKTIINDTYSNYNFNIRQSTDSCIAWLKSRTVPARKTYIDKFYKNWLLKGMNWRIEATQREQNRRR